MLDYLILFVCFILIICFGMKYYREVKKDFPPAIKVLLITGLFIVTFAIDMCISMFVADADKGTLYLVLSELIEAALHFLSLVVAVAIYTPYRPAKLSLFVLIIASLALIPITKFEFDSLYSIESTVAASADGPTAVIGNNVYITFLLASLLKAAPLITFIVKFYRDTFMVSHQEQ